MFCIVFLLFHNTVVDSKSYLPLPKIFSICRMTTSFVSRSPCCVLPGHVSKYLRQRFKTKPSKKACEEGEMKWNPCFYKLQSCLCLVTFYNESAGLLLALGVPRPPGWHWGALLQLSECWKSSSPRSDPHLSSPPPSTLHVHNVPKHATLLPPKSLALTTHICFKCSSLNLSRAGSLAPSTTQPKWHFHRQESWDQPT